MNKNILSDEINEIIATLKLILNSENNIFNQLCLDCKKSLKYGGKIMFCGNGGSAADSQHLATELVVRYQKNRKALAAISLTTDTSAITATGNDFSFKKIFSRQVEAIGKKEDLLICITTSGNSPNIIEAIRTAKKRGIKCYCFSGNKGGKIKKILKNIIIIPSNKTSVIQVCEISLGQIMCDYLERNI
ncbi:SIS domain-containing protein [Pelagibacteraceae bacterium]|nr:SIS domain-containing protein [Pelagibacteraceae bacterium]